MIPRALLALATLALAAAPAAAQSRRYPRPPVDAEAQAEARSFFWDEALRPGARQYEKLVTETTDTLRLPNADTTRVLDKLREAIGLRPDLPDAWGYLGFALERGRDWGGCAEAYGRAYAIDPRWRPQRVVAKGETAAHRRALGERPLEDAWATCLSRSGAISRAVTALESLVARGQATGETWLRLGEVYMAEGRLAEAVTALEQARSDNKFRVLARWLLAVAHDRARHPGEAEAAAAEAGDVDNPTRGPVPFVPAADVYYVRAFAARNTPEKAIALFRTYLEQAPAVAPWRGRAEEHLTALGEVDLLSRVEIEGTAERAAVERAVRPALPALRACVAAVPTVLVELRVTQVGPAARRPPPSRPLPSRPPTLSRTGRPPPPPSVLSVRRPTSPYELGRRPEVQTPGVRAMPVIFESGRHDAARDLAVDCVEKLGLSLTLPRPAAGTYSTIRIPVVADR